MCSFSDVHLLGESTIPGKKIYISNARESLKPYAFITVRLKTPGDKLHMMNLSGN